MKRLSDRLVVIVFLGLVVLCSFSSTEIFRRDTQKSKDGLLPVFPKTLKLQSGDLIFREGKGFISEALKQFNRKDPRFTHGGIVHIENGEVYVYHCVGGEGNPDNRMKKEGLKRFCSPQFAKSYGIFRPEISQEQLGAIDSLAGHFFQLGIEFDTHFDLSSDDKMYCTEMIYKVFKEVLRENNFVHLTIISGNEYVSCDNIFLHPQIQELYSYAYPIKNSNQNPVHEISN